VACGFGDRIMAPAETTEDTPLRRLFERIFEAEYDWVHHSLRRLGVRPRDVEDLAHDVFVQVYKRLASYDEARPIRPWLFAFAFRIASDYRRLARHGTELTADEVGESAATAESDLARREASTIVSRALEAMSIDIRAVFILYEIDEVPMKEIAESLGIPVNTAYSRLRLARASFEESTKPYREGGGS